MSAKVQAEGAADFAGMVEDRFPEGLVRTLERKFPDANHADCEDAVATGFEKLVVAGSMDNPRGYVTTVAVNAMKRLLRRAAFEQLAAEEEPEEPAGEGFDPTADEAIARDAYDFMRELVEKWESQNLKRATSLVLQAARLGEPLSSKELAEKLEELLGHDVLPDTARQWRKRGLDRLREELVTADLLEMETT